MCLFRTAVFWLLVWGVQNLVSWGEAPPLRGMIVRVWVVIDRAAKWTIAWSKTSSTQARKFYEWVIRVEKIDARVRIEMLSVQGCCWPRLLWTLYQFWLLMATVSYSCREETCERIHVDMEEMSESWLVWPGCIGQSYSWSSRYLRSLVVLCTHFFWRRMHRKRFCTVTSGKRLVTGFKSCTSVAERTDHQKIL